MNIIIIDDEKIAALALQKLIQDYCQQKEIPLTCKVFERAKGALDYIKSQKNIPELLFTDIRMPVMDGLDLTRQLKSDYPSILIVIISGYSDFTYAQTALKYKASDYLLKPIHRQQIFDCMDSMCGKLQADLSIQKENAYLKNQALFSRILLDKAFNLEHLMETISVDPSVSFISMICLHSPDGFAEKEKKDLLSLSPNHLVRFPMESPNRRDLFILLLYYIENFSNVCVTQQNYCQSLCSLLTLHRNTNGLSISSSEIATADRPFHPLYLQCYYSSKEQLLISDSLLPKDERKKEKNYISPYSSQMEYEIIKSFDFKNPQLTKQLFKNALLSLTSEENLSLWSLSDLVSFFVIVLNKKIHQYNERYTDIGEYIAETKITDFETIEAIETFFDEQIDRIFSLFHDKVSVPSQDVVNIMLNYIHENFFLDITLQDIASQLLFMHPSYVSRLFKSQLGISFSKYLLQYRLNVSKKMLSEYHSTSIAEIASLCGFSDCSYFVKQFKAAYGITPNAYRNQKEDSLSEKAQDNNYSKD